MDMYARNGCRNKLFRVLQNVNCYIVFKNFHLLRKTIILFIVFHTQRKGKGKGECFRG